MAHKVITFNTIGKLDKTMNFLRRARKLNFDTLDMYGQIGVEALRDATPKDTGKTANSWYYEIVQTDEQVAIRWNNSNLGDGWCPIAVILQYGHATGTGGWVEGRDYINPAIQPIFDDIANSIWRGVKNG